MHFGFNPGFNFPHQLVWFAAHAGDGGANRDVNDTRGFDERLARPAFGRRDRNRHHRRAGFNGQPGAA